jgi:hypothetical protein
MTTLLDRLTYQLDAARRFRDLAAVTMLTARIRGLREREAARPPLSALEIRWLNGDR